MNAEELLIEKAKTLTGEEARAVLAYIARLPRARRWTAQELLLLPFHERNRILESQMTKAAEFYRSDACLDMEVVDAPLEYE